MKKSVLDNFIFVCSDCKTASQKYESFSCRNFFLGRNELKTGEVTSFKKIDYG